MLSRGSSGASDGVFRSAGDFSREEPDIFFIFRESDSMTDTGEQAKKGKEMLQEVALRYASQHGLRPEKVEWACLGGDEWWLKVVTEQHSVKVVFSLDEIEDFAAEGPGSKGSKVKIRNAFASLAM
jgi:hypothetical protein